MIMASEEEKWLEEMSKHYDTSDPMWQTSITIIEGESSVTAEQLKLKNGDFEVRCEYEIKVGEELKTLKTKTAYDARLEALDLKKLLQKKIQKFTASDT